MNKQLLFFGLAVASVLVFLLVSGTFEPYKKATAFASGNNFITLDTKGDIKLQPVVDVDNAIDAAAGSIAADVADTYKTKASASSDRRYYGRTFQTKATAAADKRAAAAAYQPKGDYVKRSTNYSIKMGPGNHSSGKSNYMVGTRDNWRVAYNGGPGSKWQFV
tara:strand:+ start:739 stop:1227 length:489 start_codon:yes stop_codon:yes gene_type:complete